MAASVRLTGFVLCGCVTFAVACSSESHPPPIAGGDGTGAEPNGGGGSGGKSNHGQGGALVPDGGDEDGGGGRTGTLPDGGAGPLVTITSPTPAKDPSEPVIVTGGSDAANFKVEVHCTVVASPEGNPVDPSSVVLEMFDAGGKSLQKMGGAAGKAGDFTASFLVAEAQGNATSVPNGKVAFSCTASDTARPPNTSSTEVNTFVDHGPTITPISPAVGSAHPLGTYSFEFSVAPAPLAAGDDGAALGAVTLQVNGVDIDLGSAGDGKGNYKVSVDLEDGTLFSTKPAGPTAVVITAADERNAIRYDSYYFNVDGVGPDIVVTEPTDGAIIGGKRSLQFTVVDPAKGSGTDPSSVVVNVAGTDYLFGVKGDWSRKDDGYTFTLDSTALPATTSQFSVSINAKDFAGNKAVPAALLYYIDNQPPVVDLDPGAVRERRIINNASICSDPFDPLGAYDVPTNTGAVNDLQIVPGFAELRAIAWDETNGNAGQSVVYFSGVNQQLVRIYAQQDTQKGLLVDTNGDQVCDEVDSALIDSLPVQAMVARTPAGQPTFSSDTTNAPLPVNCGVQTQPAPTSLCNGQSDLRRVIQHEQLSTGGAPPEPVVYGIGKHADACPGGQWDLTGAGITQNGWVCIVARAVDKAGVNGNGNIGVSAPLRLCLNNPALGAAPTCANQSETPPTCMENCTIPPPRFLRRIIDVPK